VLKTVFFAQTDKPFINLSLGDPTKNPLLQPHEVLVDAVTAAVKSGRYNGYGAVDGLFEAKDALAQFYSSPEDGLEYAPSDVFLTNGASEALDMIITVLCKPGSNILFPRPGFAYSVSTNARHVEDRYYNLLPERDWEIDLDHVKTLIDENTAAIVITKCVNNAVLCPPTQLTTVPARPTPAGATSPGSTSSTSSPSPRRTTSPSSPTRSTASSSSPASTSTRLRT
jgi:aspartate/methionine/tyrosine aminotransferase